MGSVETKPPMRKIPVAGPWITEHEVALVTDAARTAWFENAGTVIGEFERTFAAYGERKHAISLPSCTSGLHLSLVALGVGPGDEVLVPECTWIATAAPINYVGATPVFVDVDPVTWCIDVARAAEVITERTKAMIPVDLYGSMPAMDDLIALCDSHGIAVVEDSAEAIGSRYHDRPAGSFGATSNFSFHGSNTLTTGEGGMVVTDDDDLYARMMFLRDHGRRPGDVSFFNDEVAFKYKMSALQAAMGLGQLQRVEELVGKKRQLFAWYQERLGTLDGVQLNAEPSGTRNAYWMSTIVLDESLGITERELAVRLAERGISTRPFFHPLSALGAYAHLPGFVDAARRNPVAYRLGMSGINLPSALSLEEDDVAYTCDAVLEILRASSTRTAGSGSDTAQPTQSAIKE